MVIDSIEECTYVTVDSTINGCSDILEVAVLYYCSWTIYIVLVYIYIYIYILHIFV